MPPPNNRLALPARNAMLDPNALGQTVPAPYIPGTTPTPASRFVPGRELENLSIGIGRGITGQLEGTKQMLTDPVGTVRSILEAARQIGADPMTVLRMLQSARQQAMSGGLGAGEMIGGMLPMPKLGNPMQELDVYHGTPHRFPPTPNNPLGEFDASKIGTGEGAQAYGHGIYYAQNPDVASPYATMNQAPSRDSLIRLRDQAPQGSTEWKHYDKLAKEKVGSFYKADLPDEMIDRMLDYDKPLNEQPLVINALKEVANRDRTGTEAVAARTARAILQKAAQAADSFGASKVTGAALHDAFLKDEIPNLKERAEFLKNLGIPGIKYLDIGSKGQPGTGTRNFVVFPGEEKKVRILERK